MDTFTESLSYDEQIVVLNNKQELVAYNDATASTQSKPQDQAYRFSANSSLSSSFQPSPHPLILADRNKALQTLSNALSAARSIRQKFEEATFTGPICPYQKTLLEYLGPNFICPTIHELALPINFNPIEAVKTITEIDKKYNDLMLTHLQIMSAEAADTHFVGITSQNLGNAFAVLSTTQNGQQYVIDKQKASRHLEFAEIVRNIPTDYILQHPFEVAQKLVGRYLEIHQDQPISRVVPQENALP